MKLLSKLNLRYITYSLLVMVVSGILIYVFISKVVTKQLDEKLTDISVRIGEKISGGGKVDWLLPFVDVSEIKNSDESSVLSDTIILNRNENEQEEFRQITVIKKINKTCYKIIVREFKIESEDLIETLADITLLAILFLTGTMIFVNRKVAKSIWTPFNKNIKKIEGFSLQNNSSLALEQTGITEFDALNNSVTKLTSQLITDFENLKQFSEDASHEIQTPLAIISAKMESMLNDAELTGLQLENIRAILASVHRLSKLNKELLLLIKIENKQFIASEKISLKKIIQEKLVEFQELIELKVISMEVQFTSDITNESNQILIELLINNLISNSINHNVQGGMIRIVQSDNSLEIWNTGRATIAHPERLFSRFYKENPSSNSVGLGLAIVAKICEVQGWKISYSFVKPLHGFRVLFET